MNRRCFLAATAVAILAPLSPAAEPPNLRAVYRYSYETNTWTRCRLYELRAGDVFRFDDEPSMRAASVPEKHSDGVWGVWAIYADIRIDPATNQWVPLAA